MPPRTALGAAGAVQVLAVATGFLETVVAVPAAVAAKGGDG